MAIETEKPKTGKGSRGPRGPRKDHARELERIREFCAMSIDVLKSFGPQDTDKCLAGQILAFERVLERMGAAK